MQIQAVLLLLLIAIGTTVLSAEVEEDEELDPFDMVNFDRANMKMRKKVPADSKPESKQLPAKEKLQETERPSPEEGKESEPAPSAKLEQQATASGKQDRVQAHTNDKQDNAQASVPGSCPALSLFQQLVSRLLRFMSGKVSKMNADTPTELCVRMRLTPDQVEVLENFKRDHSKDRVFGAHDILNEAIQGIHILNQDDPILRYSFLEEYFGITIDKVVQIVNLFVCVVALAVLLPRVHFSRRLFSWVIVSGFFVSVAMTWYRLYKGEIAKQHEALIKDLPKGCHKMEDGGSTWGSIVNFFRYQFTFQKDACVAYYEHLIIDPIVKVSPMEAFTVAVVQTMLKPMRTVGTEISEFIRALVKDLPVQWQMVTVVIVVILLIVILFLSCGYRVRIPFLLAIEPSHSDAEVKALKETIRQLQAKVQDMEALNQPPATQPQPCEAVGALPTTVNPPSDDIPNSPAIANRSAIASPYVSVMQPVSTYELPAAARPVEQEGVIQTDTARVILTDTARGRQHSQSPVTPQSGFSIPVQEENVSNHYTEQLDLTEEREAGEASLTSTDTPEDSVPPHSGNIETLGAVGAVGQSGDAVAAEHIFKD